MSILQTNYLGLSLRNPLIVSSSGLTSTLEKITRLEASGAGAVVLKSVFEEQILNETTHLENYTAYAEAADYLQFYLKEDYLGQYLNLIREAKKSLSIPVIASISCVAEGGWVDFARRIEEAGADALEINVFLLPTRRDETAAVIEQRYLSIVSTVTSAVKLPVAVKITSRFTNLLNVVEGIAHRNARGVVMFNRFYEPDINIQSLEVTEADIFSSPSELRNSIRWIAMTSAAFPQLDIAASTGIHTGEDAAKVLLAGARAFEVCSAVYRGGLGTIGKITASLEAWMQQQGFESIDEVVGKLNYSRVSSPIAYERAQFMKYFASHE